MLGKEEHGSCGGSLDVIIIEFFVEVTTIEPIDDVKAFILMNIEWKKVTRIKIKRKQTKPPREKRTKMVKNLRQL